MKTSRFANLFDMGNRGNRKESRRFWNQIEFKNTTNRLRNFRVIVLIAGRSPELLPPEQFQTIIYNSRFIRLIPLKNAANPQNRSNFKCLETTVYQLKHISL